MPQHRKKEIKEEVIIYDVVRTGKKLIVPEELSLGDAILQLKRQQEAEEERTQFTERIHASPYDGAAAMIRAMEELFGYAAAKPSMGFWGPEPPEMRSVDVGVHQSILVPWGDFSLPGIEGRVSTSFWKTPNGVVQFAIAANVKRKNETHVRRLAKRTAEIVASDSIYRGKALKIKFFDDNQQRIDIPMPIFLDLTRVKEEELIYSDEVMDAIRTNLFAPIEYIEACREHSIPFKRGVLLSGKYGTGKTLCAYVAAKKCQEKGITFSRAWWNFSSRSSRRHHEKIR